MVVLMLAAAGVLMVAVMTGVGVGVVVVVVVMGVVAALMAAVEHKSRSIHPLRLQRQPKGTKMQATTTWKWPKPQVERVPKERAAPSLWTENRTETDGAAAVPMTVAVAVTAGVMKAARSLKESGSGEKEQPPEERQQRPGQRRRKRRRKRQRRRRKERPSLKKLHR